MQRKMRRPAKDKSIFPNKFVDLNKCVVHIRPTALTE